MIQIDAREQLQAFARTHRLRPDWHEPDEQGINAFVIGTELDNAMGSNTIPDNFGELNVILTVDDEPAAVVNLSTLLSWAVR